MVKMGKMRFWGLKKQNFAGWRARLSPHKTKVLAVSFIFLSVILFFYLVTLLINNPTNKTSQASITILNPQSYPTVGGNWWLGFETTGKADLTITAINETRLSNENENHDLRFLELRCGSEIVDYELQGIEAGSGVFVSDYSCDKEAYARLKVFTRGTHTLEIRFGANLEYAYNSAGSKTWTSQADFDSGNKINTTSNSTGLIKLNYTATPTELDYMEYANDAAAQAAYVSSDADAVPTSEYSSDSYTKLLLHMDGTNGTNASSATDSSASAHTISGSYGQAHLSTDQYKFGTAALRLDGTGDYLSLLDSDDWNFGSGAFTIDWWVRFNDVAANQNFYDQVEVPPPYDRNHIWYRGTGYNLIYVDTLTDGSIVRRFTAPFTPDADTWYHMALVRIDNADSADSWRFYIDGTALELTMNTGSWSPSWDDVAAPLFIGGSSFSFNGWIDELRISKGIARWTSNFDVENLQSYSESAIKQQGSYSLKAVAQATNSLNDNLTRTVSPTIDLSGKGNIEFGANSSRTGSNFDILIRDSGGTWTTKSVTINSNEWENNTWDLSGVADADKDAIDRIVINITNADAANTFYIDNLEYNKYAATGTWNVTYNVSVSADTGLVWNYVNWTESLPAGTDIEVRTRTASTEAGLASASWTGWQGANYSVSKTDEWIELMVNLSTTDTSKTSVLHEITLNYNEEDRILWTTPAYAGTTTISGNTLPINVSFTDSSTNLYDVECNVTHSNGSNMWGRHIGTDRVLSNTSFNITEDVDVSAWPEGNYSMTCRYRDA